MKLLIFGATRGTGYELIEQALGRGHQVTAFARDPGKIEIRHENLEVIQGDVLDPGSVERAVKGMEVVLSAIGAPPSSKDPVRSEGTRNIVRAMERFGVRRFISLSTHGVGDTRGTLPPLYKYILVPIFLRRVFADHEVQENYIRESHLDWTIVRPTALTDGRRTGSYRHGFSAAERNLKNKISRADVADFMLAQLSGNAYLRKTPALSY
jgi:putative NADH-flavin reductase